MAPRVRKPTKKALSEDEGSDSEDFEVVEEEDSDDDFDAEDESEDEKPKKKKVWPIRVRAESGHLFLLAWLTGPALTTPAFTASHNKRRNRAGKTGSFGA